MRRALGWQGALRTSVSCLPVNAALRFTVYNVNGARTKSNKNNVDTNSGYKSLMVSFSGLPGYGKQAPTDKVIHSGF